MVVKKREIHEKINKFGKSCRETRKEESSEGNNLDSCYLGT
jgi:hypothetical protein